MNTGEDKNTRYFIDLDLSTKKIIGWDYGSKYELIQSGFEHPAQHRIFISKGQYNKLVANTRRLFDALD